MQTLTSINIKSLLLAHFSLWRYAYSRKHVSFIDEAFCLFSLQAVSLFKSYFGGAFDEDAIRNNFVLIYELLDGMPPCKV